MVTSRDQNVVRHNIKLDNRSFEKVEQFKYLGTNITDQNSIEERIKSEFRECLLSFGAEDFDFLFAIQKCKYYTELSFFALFFLGVKLGRSHWENRRLRVFEIMVLGRIFRPKREEVTGKRRKLLNEELNDLYPSPNIIRVIKSKRMGWAGHIVATVF